MATRKPSSPDWDRLFVTAAGQSGLFTTEQAAQAGYSPQLLAHHLRARRILRVRRGVYRVVHFPESDNEDLVAVWFWSERAGIFSHQTALWLHQLLDVVPARTHLTLPDGWRERRLRVPPRVVLHHAEIGHDECEWHGAVPLTSPGRTLNDCAEQRLSPELLTQAARQALRRGLVTREDLGSIDALLEAIGGLPE